MDYRILFVYDDASCREMYGSTQADVVNLISNEIKNCNDSDVHRSLTVHVSFIWKS